METLKLIIGVLAVILLFNCVLYATFEMLNTIMNFRNNCKAWKEWKAKRKEGAE